MIESMDILNHERLINKSNNIMKFMKGYTNGRLLLPTNGYQEGE